MAEATTVNVTLTAQHIRTVRHMVEILGPIASPEASEDMRSLVLHIAKAMHDQVPAIREKFPDDFNEGDSNVEGSTNPEE